MKSYKVCIVGDAFTGKSTNKGDIKFILYDIAGQERFKVLTYDHFKNIDGVIYFFDLTNKESYDHLQSHKRIIDDFNTGKELPSIVCGNKRDIKDMVMHRDKIRWYKEYDFLYFNLSVKHDNIERSLLFLARKLTNDENILFYNYFKNYNE